jgi:hypothetical protein
MSPILFIANHSEKKLQISGIVRAARSVLSATVTMQWFPSFRLELATRRRLAFFLL